MVMVRDVHSIPVVILEQDAITPACSLMPCIKQKKNVCKLLRIKMSAKWQSSSTLKL